MKLPHSILLLAAALAGPAAAQEIRVSLVGKDPATIHTEIGKAAHDVCQQGFMKGVVNMDEINRCTRIEAEDGQRQANAYERKLSRVLVAGLTPGAAGAPRTR
jgi:hypothetical protein